MAEKIKREYSVSVSTTLDEKLVEKVDCWAERSWRDRSKVLSAILTAVLKMVQEDNNFQEDLNKVVHRLRLRPA